MKNIPKFVRVGFASKSWVALRFTDGRYYRDAGDWEVDFRHKDGKIFVCDYSPNVAHMNGLELVPITFQEWKDDNGQYAPSFITE